MEAQIGRQIFAEVRHPPVEPEIKHPLADHILGKPVAGGRVGEIDDAGVKLAEIDEVGRVTVEAAGEEALRRSFGIERAVDRKIGVHIAQKADAPRLQRRDARGQIGVAGRVPLPVPEQPPPEARLADADPVLAPQAGNRRPRIDQRVEPVETRRTLLQARNRSAQRPIGQALTRTEARAELAGEIGWRAFEQVDLRLARPHVHTQPPWLSRIEFDIFRIGEADRPSGRTQHGGLGIVGGPVIPAREAPVGARQIGERRAGFAPHPGLAGPDRKVSPVQNEIAHLLTPAPQHIIWAENEVERDAIL